MPGFDPYDALVPIYVSIELPRRFEQIGTAVFIEFEGNPILLTAAHVLDERTHGQLMVPAGNGFAYLDGYLAHSDLLPEDSIREDTVDVGYVRLTSVLAAELAQHFRPLPRERCMVLQSALELGVCSASGYPATKSKKNGGVYSSEVFSARGVAAGAETYERLALSPVNSAVVHFHKKRAANRKTGSRASTPSYRGISGGGLFAWPRGAELSEDWTLPNLVGIVHTYRAKEGLFVATTLINFLVGIGLGQMKGFGGVE